jgi:hypothetical protein
MKEIRMDTFCHDLFNLIPSAFYHCNTEQIEKIETVALCDLPSNPSNLRSIHTYSIFCSKS